MMRKLVVVIILILLGTIKVFPQTSIVGTWKIDELLGYYDKNEYVLNVPPTDIPHIWTKYVRLNEDNFFSSYKSVRCGNEDRAWTNGNYELVDSNYIRIT